MRCTFVPFSLDHKNRKAGQPAWIVTFFLQVVWGRGRERTRERERVRG